MVNRRRPTPWIHRWSRPLIAAIAGLGILNTGYLTATKLFGGETACPTSGCEQVLSGPYATVFGLPLSLFGFLAYLSMAVFALAPLVISRDPKNELRQKLEQWTWLLLFAGASAMTVFSAYLMYIMVTKYVLVYGTGGICVYCIGSALSATTLLVLTVLGRAWEDVGQLVFMGLIIAMVTLIGTLGLYAPVNKPAVGMGASAGQVGPPIVAQSGEAEIALAKYLKQQGVKMYGAYWCPHCHDQKELFGEPAFSEINYIECDPNGQNSQTKLCQSVGIQGYPTWEIKGKLESGTKSLQELAQLSGYTGPTNFLRQP